MFCFYFIGLSILLLLLYVFFFFNDTATTEIYTLSLHDALPIWPTCWSSSTRACCLPCIWARSEEHTSELQSRVDLVCRLLLEKKKKQLLAFNFFYIKKKKNIIKNFKI